MNKVTDNKYVFSCYIKKNIQILKRRPWWNLFGRDKFVPRCQWVRVILSDLNEAQSQALREADFLSGVWPSLFMRAIDGSAEGRSLIHGVELVLDSGE